MSLVLCLLTLRVVGGFCWKSFHKVGLYFVGLVCCVWFFFFFNAVQFHSFTKSYLTLEINSEMQCPCLEM